MMGIMRLFFTLSLVIVASAQDDMASTTGGAKVTRPPSNETANATSAPANDSEPAADANATDVPVDDVNGTAAPLDSPITVDGTLADAVNERNSEGHGDPEGLSFFRDAMQAVGLFDSMLGNTSGVYTVFAPTNAAINASAEWELYLHGLSDLPLPKWHYNLRQALLQHIVPDMALSSATLFDATLNVVSVKTLRDDMVVNLETNQVGQGATLIENDVIATNGVLHVVDKIVEAPFESQSFAQLELQEEFGPDHLNRTALKDVVDFIGARDLLNVYLPEGQTFVGCRIRAFNRIEDYLDQTINTEAPELGVIHGEFLNETFKEQTRKNLVQYSLIPKNYVLDDIPEGFAELTVPVAKCGHMWVTKRSGKLCFNNGCVVETPDPRVFAASNGIGYVIDKCQVCPGIAMLTNVAWEYTNYNVRDVAQFFVASEWNLRNLSISVGDGSLLTLFASISTGWSIFNTDDTTRLAGDEWKPHQLDLLAHMLVQGSLTKADLQARFDAEGPYNLTSLLGQPIPVDMDSETQVLTIAGGEVLFPDIQGVDGLVHFTDKLPLPKSVTHSVYDMANEDERFSTQISYIDVVYLAEDMRRLLPLTALYAPNEQWEGKKTKMEEIAKNVLKSHMFEKLYWCDELRSRNNTNVTSLNERSWFITLNEKNFPCFEAAEATEGEKPARACITKCDVLARNGIVHELDSIMLFEAAETRSPSEFVGTAPEDTPDTTPTVFKRPSPATASDAVTPPDLAPEATSSSAPLALAHYSVISLAILAYSMLLC